jgi:hypothetical protein
MASNESSTTDQLTITVEGMDLPQNEEERDAFLNGISQAIQRTAEEKGASEPNNITVSEGHQFSYLPAECPRCGEDPHISGLTMLPEEKSIANAKLECRHCSYTGGVKYRLVDIETNKYNSEKGREEYRSIVADGDVKPQYQSY